MRIVTIFVVNVLLSVKIICVQIKNIKITKS